VKQPVIRTERKELCRESELAHSEAKERRSKGECVGREGEGLRTGIGWKTAESVRFGGQHPEVSKNEVTAG